MLEVDDQLPAFIEPGAGYSDAKRSVAYPGDAPLSFFLDTLWTAWIDNQGVLHSLIRGGGSNSLIVDFTLELERRRVALWAGRVESESNIADGPTRDDLSKVSSLGALWAEPRWPPWARR